MNRDFHMNNRQRLGLCMEDDSLTVIFAGKAKKRSQDTNYPFAPDRNFYYMTGVEEENCILLLNKAAGRTECHLFAERPDEYHIRYFGPMRDKEQWADYTGVDNVHYLDEFGNIFGKLNANHGYQALYLDLSRRSMDRELNEAGILAQDVKLMYPQMQIKNVFPAIFNMRIIKSPLEQDLLRQAIDITGKGIEAILRGIKPHVGENELQASFEYVLKVMGSGGNGFNPIIASGPNSLALHYEKNCRKLREDELVLLDLGAEYSYYSADISRTFPTSGRFTDKQRYYYQAVLESQNEAIAIMRPGVEMRKTREAANKVLCRYLKKDGIITSDDEVVKYLNHGICHCIGLDVHEGDSMVMAKDMVLTCEPGVYLHEYGFGIRIEDDILITSDGHEVMSDSIIKDAKDIENFMKNALH